MNREIKRGDIYMADLSPTIGSEQTGVRPVLVIQNDIGNKFSPTIIVAVISSSEIKLNNMKGKKMPTHVLLDTIRDGLKNESIIFLEQIRTIDKNRLAEYCTTLDKQRMQEVDKCLMVSVGLS